MKVRQDAWSHEEDLLLAETVLRHIREGSTQLKAFEEVGDKLNRTAAACGFRWNAEVRKKYNKAMELAKKQRKERKRALAQQAKQLGGQAIAINSTIQVPTSINDSAPDALDSFNLSDGSNEKTEGRQVETKEEKEIVMNLDSVITYLYSLKNFGLNSHILKAENERLTRENKQLLEEKDKLEKKLKRMKQESTIIQEDYQALVQIMDRARRMMSFSDGRTQTGQPYISNNDENLDQIAK
ncbi:RsfA family transcriptional regulator [Calidifontibacillus erzurumensis]|uniref:RsfA family transcriptional regulator n=1 Tax=Calidifontibacillus erzurumensis TaxID=2741433 RepID=A0A8J8KA11_9BACI|nr:RsfA family transcriptional regulator [Calidifontibacillus erzurumensis]NSL50182.1 RsfA family transcriptional regulator [Calidifontibacillus erzurumensis]